MISILDIVHDTMVDGPGFRTSIYCAGCSNACPGCHNPQSWDINNGKLMTTKEIMDIIKVDPFANVTFSGGDPMFQPEGFTELADAIRTETAKTIWCFTGFNYETLIKNHAQSSLRHFAFHNSVVNGNRSFVIAIPNVKMRRTVIIVIH